MSNVLKVVSDGPGIPKHVSFQRTMHFHLDLWESFIDEHAFLKCIIIFLKIKSSLN